MNRQLGLLVCAVALLPLVFVGVAAEDSGGFHLYD